MNFIRSQVVLKFLRFYSSVFIRHFFPLHFKQVYAHHFSYSAISFLLLLRPS